MAEFGKYLYCQDDQNNVEHTVFKCPMWERKRGEVKLRTDEESSPDSIIRLMLRSEEDWRSIADFIVNTITENECHERRAI